MLELKAESQNMESQTLESQNAVYATFEIRAQQSALLSLSANGVLEFISVDGGSIV